MAETSVVIPAFNAERYVGSAVESVLSQSHRDLEVFVVDDGSTDATVDVARAAAAGDSRVEVLSIAKSGSAAARNRGLAQASGSLVAFLDADDLWDADKIHKQLTWLQSSPDTVVLGGLLVDVRADGSEARLPRFLRPTLGVDTSSTESQDLVRRALLYPFALSSTLFRTDALRAVNGFDETLPGGFLEDVDLLARIASQGRVDTLMEVVGRRRISATSMTSRAGFQAARSSRFIRERLEARIAGGDLTWEQFDKGRPVTFADRRAGFALSCHQSGRVKLFERRPFTAGVYVAAAAIAWPGFIPRLVRSSLRRWVVSSRGVHSSSADEACAGSSTG